MSDPVAATPQVLQLGFSSADAARASGAGATTQQQ